MAVAYHLSLRLYSTRGELTNNLAGERAMIVWKPDLSSDAPPDARNAELVTLSGRFRLTIFNTETAAGFEWRIHDLGKDPPVCMASGLVDFVEEAERRVTAEAIRLGLTLD